MSDQKISIHHGRLGRLASEKRASAERRVVELAKKWRAGPPLNGGNLDALADAVDALVKAEKL